MSPTATSLASRLEKSRLQLEQSSQVASLDLVYLWCYRTRIAARHNILSRLDYMYCSCFDERERKIMCHLALPVFEITVGRPIRKSGVTFKVKKWLRWLHLFLFFVPTTSFNFYSMIVFSYTLLIGSTCTVRSTCNLQTTPDQTTRLDQTRLLRVVY